MLSVTDQYAGGGLTPELSGQVYDFQAQSTDGDQNLDHLRLFGLATRAEAKKSPVGMLSMWMDYPNVSTKVYGLVPYVCLPQLHGSACRDFGICRFWFWNKYVESWFGLSTCFRRVSWIPSDLFIYICQRPTSTAQLKISNKPGKSKHNKNQKESHNIIVSITAPQYHHSYGCSQKRQLNPVKAPVVQHRLHLMQSA